MAEFTFYSREFSGSDGRGNYFLFESIANHANGYSTETVVTLWPETQDAQIRWYLQTGTVSEIESHDYDVLWDNALTLIGMSQDKIEELVEEFRILDAEPND